MSNKTNSIRGIHVSPGIYTKETVLSHTDKALGITSLGLAGETLRGPAFQPIEIADWQDFARVFGGTNPAKYKASQYPKYELPYIAQSYLTESKKLTVVRTLGLSGVNAGPAWVITAKSKDGSDYDNMVVAVLRSRGEHKKALFKKSANAENGICEDQYEYDAIDYYAKDVVLDYSKSLSMGGICSTTVKASEIGYNKDGGYFTSTTLNYGVFTICVTVDGDGDVKKNYSVTLNPSDKNYILNVLGTSPEEDGAEVYVEELYDVALATLVNRGEIIGINQNMIAYPNRRIVPKFKPVYDLLTEDPSLLKRTMVGRRYLYTDMSKDDSGESLKVRLKDKTGGYGKAGKGTPGWIYTVSSQINSRGEREYFYAHDDDGGVTDALPLEKNLYNELGDVSSDGSGPYYMDCVYCQADGSFYIFDEEDERVKPITLDLNNYREGFRYSSTPWFLSELRGSAAHVELFKLFRFHTISDGSESSTEIKVSIENINPDRGTFDVIVRDFYDTDASKKILERYKGCTLVPGDSSYIAYKIGSFDGNYVSKSKYITVEVNENERTRVSVPCGFMGYPIRDWGGTYPSIKGNTIASQIVWGAAALDPAAELSQANVNAVLEKRCTIAEGLRCVTSKEDLSYVDVVKKLKQATVANVTDFTWSANYCLGENEEPSASRVNELVNARLKALGDLVITTAEWADYKAVNEAISTLQTKKFNSKSWQDAYCLVMCDTPTLEVVNDLIVKRLDKVSADSTYTTAMLGGLSAPIGASVWSDWEKVTAIIAGLYSNANGASNKTADNLDSNSVTAPYFQYNTTIDSDLRPSKQYFGISDKVGIDEDMFRYKGVEAYADIPAGHSPCFHLDARIIAGKPDDNGAIKEGNGEKAIEQTVSIDGVTGFAWSTVSRDETLDGYDVEPRIGTNDEMEFSIYEDIRYRKFTVAFYGGWDGWDYYRTSRSNTNDFTYQNYRGYINTTSGVGSSLSVLSNPEAYGFDANEKCLDSDYYAYLYAIRRFANPSEIDINVIATPGIDYVNQPHLVNSVIEMVEEERADTVYVMTTPDKPFGANDSENEMFTPQDAVDNLDDSEIDSSYCTTFYPNVKYFDEDNSQYIYLPPTRDVVRNLALTDNTRFPWFAAAGWERGTLLYAEGAKKTLKIDETDTLYSGRINYINRFAKEGWRLWGDKNMQIEDNVMNRLSKRRLALRIRKLLAVACIGLIFDPNDNTLGRRLDSAISSVMSAVASNRGVVKWYSEIDDSQETRDRLTLGAKLYIQPMPNLEYIEIEMIMDGSGVSFVD